MNGCLAFHSFAPFTTNLASSQRAKSFKLHLLLARCSLISISPICCNGVVFLSSPSRKKKRYEYVSSGFRSNCRNFSQCGEAERSEEDEDEDKFMVVNFYKLVFIENPEEEVSKHLSFMEVCLISHHSTSFGVLLLFQIFIGLKFAFRDVIYMEEYM